LIRIPAGSARRRRGRQRSRRGAVIDALGDRDNAARYQCRIYRYRRGSGGHAYPVAGRDDMVIGRSGKCTGCVRQAGRPTDGRPGTVVKGRIPLIRIAAGAARRCR
jgi:hypothetical protein